MIQIHPCRSRARSTSFQPRYFHTHIVAKIPRRDTPETIYSNDPKLNTGIYIIVFITVRILLQVVLRSREGGPPRRPYLERIARNMVGEWTAEEGGKGEATKYSPKATASFS